MEKTFEQGTIRECCKKSENMIPQKSDKEEMKINKCGVCRRNHYRLMAEPGIFGLRGKPIGHG
jgi:hypothetical protein